VAQLGHLHLAVHDGEFVLAVLALTEELEDFWEESTQETERCAEECEHLLILYPCLKFSHTIL